MVILGLGYTMVVVSLLIGCYYNVIITYTLRYLYDSIAALALDGLPWETCENRWNNDKCMDVERLGLCKNIAANGTENVIIPGTDDDTSILTRYLHSLWFVSKFSPGKPDFLMRNTTLCDM